MIGSDKDRWHRYTETYLKAFDALGPARSILEFGVFQGDSIRWLHEIYPEAGIVGADILAAKASWPTGPDIQYVIVDQGDRSAIARMFEALGRQFDLVIEDGSHVPTHQRNSLLGSLRWMGTSSLYILEDIHTSQTELRASGLVRPAFKRWPLEPRSQLGRVWNRAKGVVRVDSNRGVSRPRRNVTRTVNCLTLVLALERARCQGRVLSEADLDQLTATGFFTRNELEVLDERVSDVQLYRRSGLPLNCYRCGSADFDLTLLQCSCGTPVYRDDDSMTALLWLR